MSNKQKKSYCYCAVESCNNSSFVTPTKHFFTVPKGVKNKLKRNSWLQAIGKDPKRLSVKSNFRVCQDHFSIPEDIEIIGSTDQMKLKPGVVPHINLWFENADTSTSDISSIHTDIEQQHVQAAYMEADSGYNHTIYLTDNVPHEVEPQHEDDDNMTLCEDVHIPSHPLGDSDHNDDHVTINQNNSGRNNSTIVKCTIQKIENFTVCKKTKVRNKKHQVSTADLGVSCGTSPFKIAIKNQACSPLKWNVTDVKSLTNSTAKRKPVFTFDTISLHSSVDTDSSYDFSSDDSIVRHSDQSDLSSDFKHKSLLRCRELMSLYPRMYLGVDKEWISILSLISNKIYVRKSSNLTPTDVIYLLFRKMRLNESFSILGHEFGIS